MDLSFWLTTLSLAILAYAGAQWLWGQYVVPRRAARAAGLRPERAPSVKKKRRALAFKKRSRGSERSNPANAGSERQDTAAPPVNVQPNVQRSAPPAAPAGAAAAASGDFTLSARELAQLAEALHLRQEGATVEEALKAAFGVSKGASAGYVRAKAIWDAATVAPGAAPSGTYTTPNPVRRRKVAR